MLVVGAFLALAGLGILPPSLAVPPPDGGRLGGSDLPVALSPSWHSPEATPRDQEPPELQGRLLHEGEALGATWVMLHRVRGNEASAVDSVRVEGNGTFRFDLPAGAEDAEPGPTAGFWFLTTRRDGVIYASDPIDPVGASGAEEVLLRTYPARPVPPGGIMLPLEGREISLGPRRKEGRWQVVDRFRIRNDSLATFVAGDDGPVVWQAPLPSGAVAVRYVDGDPLPDGVFFQGAGVQVTAPLRPGATVLTLTYELSSLEFRIPLPGTTEGFVLRAAPALPRLVAEGLEGPFSSDPGAGSDRAARGFAIWTGTDLENRILHVAPAAPDGAPPAVALLLGAVLVGVAVLVTLRRRDDGEEPLV